MTVRVARRGGVFIPDDLNADCLQSASAAGLVTVPETTPVWAAAVVAARTRPIAEPANLAKKRVPPGERDVRIFPPEWNYTARSFVFAENG